MVPTSDWLTVACGISLALSITVVAFRYWRRSSVTSHFPPGPPRIPVLGNLLNLTLSSPWTVFTRWKYQYGKHRCESVNANYANRCQGDVVGLDVLGHKFVILNSYEAIHDLLEKRASVYSDRPFTPFIGQLLALDQVRDLSLIVNLLVVDDFYRARS